MLVAALWFAALRTFAQPCVTTHAPPQDRRVFFGDLHLHTALSLDAWNFGTDLLPNDAYRFAEGKTVMVPAAQVAREQGIVGNKPIPAKREWPLDFLAVTDHSEYMGTMVTLDDPDSPFAKSALGKWIIAHRAAAFSPALMQARRKHAGPAYPYLSNPEPFKDAWQMVMKAANDNYQPCRFTTFIAYEWSSLPDGRNLHRNVIFDADHAPLPFTALDSQRPEDLWKYLDRVRSEGIPVIAIPHNPDASGGWMFNWHDSYDQAITAEYARERARNEPLVEIVQIKGQSDTVPILSPNDEFADFEIYDHLLVSPLKKSDPNGSYVRQAYGRGLVIWSRVGVNPFKFGVVGDSDIHDALSASYEDAFAGGQFGIDPGTMLPRGDRARQALGLAPPPRPIMVPKNMKMSSAFKLAMNRILVERSSAGLTGVWAGENTRDSIFAALQRKETFATSGTRIRLRVFGGWDFQRRMLGDHSWVAEAYAQGVPMGGDLPARSTKADAAPTFLIQAAKDPTGANLDRIQMIKVSLDGQHHKEEIFDVAVSGGRKIDAASHLAAPVGNTVNLATGKYTNSIGAPVLTGFWRDPDFNPVEPAVYYVRVLEIPTPRWSTLLAVKNKLPLSPYVPATIQERAWSSPIWYTPAFDR